MKGRPLDKYVQTGFKKSIITKCLHLKSHLNIVWTDTQTDKTLWKGLTNLTISLCGFFHPQLVDEIDCTPVSLSRPKQFANARTYPASAQQAQKHIKTKTRRLCPASIPSSFHTSLQTSSACKQAIFVLSDHKYCFGRVVWANISMKCTVGRYSWLFFSSFFGFSIKAQRLLSGRGVEVQVE